MYGSHLHVNPNHYQIYSQNYNQWRPNYGARFPRGICQINNPWKQEPIQACNEEYWCETCDRGFQSKQLLDNHKKQHQKCNIDGCQFVAHPKVITKHIQMQHSSGLYNKIAKLDNPEEIKKWREERRKKYPTKDNIDKKAAEVKEKNNRGEKMGLECNRNIRNCNSGIGTKRQYNFENDNYHKQNSRKPTRNNIKHPQPNKIQKIMPTVDKSRKLKPFTGILDLVMAEDVEVDEKSEKSQCNFLIEDDECIQESFNHLEQTSKIVEPAVCNALSSLICNYGSSDEEINVENNGNINIDITDKKQELVKINLQIDSPKQGDENNSDNDSGPEETKIFKNIDTESTVGKDQIVKKVSTECSHKKMNTSSNKGTDFTKKKIKNQNHQQLDLKKARRKLPSTLLEKLLQKEILHERNVILQCIRHIVNNNYFD